MMGGANRTGRGCALVLFACALSACASMASDNPDAVEALMLSATPLGSTVADVERYCQRKKLSCKYDADRGFYHQEPNHVVGVSHMTATLDERTVLYQGYPLARDTQGHWGFDSQGRLVGVWAWITLDGP